MEQIIEIITLLTGFPATVVIGFSVTVGALYIAWSIFHHYRVRMALKTRAFDGPYRVVHIVDGDTIDVKRWPWKPMRVRLIGIETAEMHGEKVYQQAAKRGHNPQEERRQGRNAKEYLKRRIKGRLVGLEMDPRNAERDHTGRYGRRLAYVWLLSADGKATNINKALIADGHGWATPYRHKRRREFGNMNEKAYGVRHIK